MRRSISILWSVFVRDFRKQKGRMTLTIVGLVWGTISIMLLLSFGEGLYQQMSLNEKGMGEGFAVVWAGRTSIEYAGMPKGRRLVFVPDDIEFFARKMPELQTVTGEYTRWGVKVSFEGNYIAKMINGLYPVYETLRAHYPQRGGRFINELDISQKRRVAFLGHKVAAALMPGDSNPVGKTILIAGAPFLVIGVQIPKLQSSSYYAEDADKISIPATTYQAIWNDPYVDNLLLAPRDQNRSDMKDVEERFRQVAAAKMKFDPTDKDAMSVWDVVESQNVMAKILLGLKYFLAFIGFMTLAIAGVGVANIMYVSVKERTREIGVKMAMGARRSTILWQFVCEALFVTFTGGAIGMLLIYCLTESFKIIPIQNDVLDFMGRPTVSLADGLTIIVILGMMGLVSGYFPARRAASVSPVESLRYE